MRAIVRKLTKKLKPDDAAERCGLILQSGKVIEAKNLHPKPDNGFILDCKALLEHEDKLVGTWHTHVGGRPSQLSQEDYLGFRQWPGLTHYIVAHDGVRAYRVEDNFVQEVDLAVD